MSARFYNNIEEQVIFANFNDGKLKTVKEARKNLKTIINHAVSELNTLMSLNNRIDKMIASGEFLTSEEYEKLCKESNRHFHEIHKLHVVKNFNLLINLLGGPDLVLAKAADELIYLMHLHEDDIKARQSMAWHVFGK